jgi:hypothetical protein
MDRSNFDGQRAETVGRKGREGNQGKGDIKEGRISRKNIKEGRIARSKG